MSQALSARIAAFLIHLLASVTIALFAVVLVFWLWYPAPLHKATGVTDIFLIILAVDVVLGPLLTLVVYKTGKPSLRFDLGVIVVLQLSALAYGLHTVAEGRPAWIAFAVDRFDLVRVNEIDRRGLERAEARYRGTPWFGPGWVAAIPPADADERGDLVFDALATGLDLTQRPQYYQTLEHALTQLLARARPLAELERYNDATEVAAILQRWPAADRWVPLKGFAEAMTVLIDGERGAVVAIVDLRPWL
jgi:hypothetical protein